MKAFAASVSRWRRPSAKSGPNLMHHSRRVSQPYSAARHALELFSCLSIAAAQPEYDQVIPKFPV